MPTEIKLFHQMCRFILVNFMLNCPKIQYLAKNQGNSELKGGGNRCSKSKQRFMYRPSSVAGLLCSKSRECPKSKNPKSRDYCICTTIRRAIKILQFADVQVLNIERNKPSKRLRNCLNCNWPSLKDKPPLNQAH